jgi:hypothetical protein
LRSVARLLRSVAFCCALQVVDAESFYVFAGETGAKKDLKDEGT